MVDREAEDNHNDRSVFDLDDAAIEAASELEIGYKLKYSNLICNQRVLHAALSGSIATVVYCALEPIMSLRLLDYNLTDGQTGSIFGIQPLTYALSTILVPYIIPKWVEGRVILITNLMILGVVTTLVGPFFEELNLVVMMIGLALSGFCMGFLYIPNMPEMMKGTKEKHPEADLDHANSLLSGILNAGFGTG